VTDPRTSLVAAGYDAMVDTYEAWKGRIVGDPTAEWCAELVGRLAPGATVIELGCGGGTEETRLLAERFRLTGIDISAVQLERARQRVPAAVYLQADITTIGRPAGSLDAVAAFYVLNHLPRELLGPLFERIHEWLRPGGLLLASLGASDNPGWRGDWLGAPMYFAGFSPDINRQLLDAAGFTRIRDELVTIREPAGDATFHWVLVQR
jgi:predicted TPR repeat methyltransferase